MLKIKACNELTAQLERGVSGHWSIVTKVTESKDYIQCLFLMTGDIKQLSVQATLLEFTVCLSIMIHTLIPWLWFLILLPTC